MLINALLLQAGRLLVLDPDGTVQGGGRLRQVVKLPQEPSSETAIAWAVAAAYRRIRRRVGLGGGDANCSLPSDCGAER
ncbi:hypothetical protein [Pseudopontixanthobacter vadosimaris]|uniref:hypothetical protein n=1 Tax=Pseudopontixanthobacter vadosimaris TaxID=2726450 RepID=UPI001475BCC1|nr:hypothetical protein [Pseudopontixanthobacter vadosimaris]